jgi:hypothetical protein
MSKQRPPLTPTDSEYSGMDEHEIHKLRWRSQSRDGVTHTTTGTTAGADYCTCEAFQWSLVGDGPIGCKHTRCWSDALAHHLDPPPADPGGAALDRAQADADDEADVWEAELRRIRHDEGLRALYG